MRLSRTLAPTTKENPADAEVVSHQLMLRAGLIRQLASGLYTWLPLGWRSARKVEQIVREEMDRAGALEILMPTVQPAELWRESERWDKFGPELLRLMDRHEREFCVGPTHEEVVTDLARRDIRSYKQLPLNLYQIQTKFRDEVRPRFGVMRSREFIMKDAYSFNLDKASLDASYRTMYETYQRIFERTGLDYRVVEADSGAIGGSHSHEFHVLAESGEDLIAFSNNGKYAANIELVACAPPSTPRPAPVAEMEKVATPGQETIAQLAAFLDVPSERCLKTLLVEGDGGGIVALVLRGDHELNAIKAAAIDGVAAPLRLAPADLVRDTIGCTTGSIGPVGLEIPIRADHAALVMGDFVCGANEAGQHYTGVNWERDLPQPAACDIRNAVNGDPSPDGSGTLSIARGIEVGHIFQLGTTYSRSMNAVVLDENGKAVDLEMGCYGIGVTRVVAAAIEQNHDANGIVWPTAIAPYEVVLLPINAHRSVRVTEAVEKLYEALVAAGVEVLLDDRGLRPGVMFADADLMGMPHRVTIGERGLDKGVVEYRRRRESENQDVPIDTIATLLIERLGAER